MTEQQKLHPELLGILQHSLGVDEHGRGAQYRNHFVAGGENLKRCRELVGYGFMVEHKGSELTGGAPWFSVSDAGKEAVALQSPPPPKLTRSQQRYQDYLDEDCCVTFGEWLRYKRPRQAA